MNTYNPLVELQYEMDRLFDDFRVSPATRSRSGESFSPACEIEEAADHYLVALEVPGIPKDDLKIEVVDSHLVVSGERRLERRDQKQNAGWYTERRFGKFQRSFNLPQGAELDKIEAQYQDGILRLAIPKAAEKKPRQIEIGTTASGGLFQKILGSRKTDNERVA